MARKGKILPPPYQKEAEIRGTMKAFACMYEEYAPEAAGSASFQLPF